VRIRSLITASALLLGVMACGGDSPTEPAASHQNIAGSYAGIMTGVSQGVAADLDFTLTLLQSSGSLTGSYAISGTLSDGVDQVAVQGTGTLTGAVATGTNPSVNITVKSGVCPTYSAQFAGAYDSTNRRLTITGPVEFFGAGSCSVALSYPTTIVLTR
jgi:hypothetical protein